MHVHKLADKAALSSIRKQIRSELNGAGAPTHEAFDCLVAVTEACTNALVHGADADNGRPPEVVWTIAADLATFEIRDFSNKEGAEPIDATTEEEIKAGGYGLRLMRKLMDRVDVRFSPRGTTVVMEKKFPPATV